MSKKTIFISHAGPQAPLAFAVDQLLTEAGHNTIIYERDFPKDSDFVDEIADALVDADYVICLVSAAFVTSNWCVKEYLVADSASKLIPFIVEKCDVSSLPASIKGASSLQGLSSERAATKVGKELEQLVPTLHPQRLATKQVRKTIERALLIFPLFEGGHEAGRWQDHAVAYTQSLFRDENILIKALPEYVRSEKEARNLLRQYDADIVIYGKFRGGEVEMGFVSSRGWNMIAGREDVKVPSDLRFKARSEHFRDLTLVLKLAFGNLEAGRNRHKRAVTHFSEALGQGVAPERAREYGMAHIYAHRGYQHLLMREFSLAIQDFDRAIGLEPTMSFAYKNRAGVRIFLGEFDKALIDLDEAIRLNAGYASAYLSRGLIRDLTGQGLELALHDLDIAVKLAPDNVTAHHNRGSILWRLGRYELASLSFAKAIQLDPRCVMAYHRKAASHNMLGQYQEALDDFEVAFRLDPKLTFPPIKSGDFHIQPIRHMQAVVYNDRGLAYSGLGKYAEAISDFTRAIKLHPFPVTFNNRGKAYELLGRSRDALHDYESFLKLAGEDDPWFLPIRRKVENLKATLN